MSIPSHNLDEVRAALLGAGFDVPRIVLASWNLRQIHQACSWAKWTREPWKHGLPPRFPRILERFDARVPHCQRAGENDGCPSRPIPTNPLAATVLRKELEREKTRLANFARQARTRISACPAGRAQ